MLAFYIKSCMAWLLREMYQCNVEAYVLLKQICTLETYHHASHRSLRELYTHETWNHAFSNIMASYNKTPKRYWNTACSISMTFVVSQVWPLNYTMQATGLTRHSRIPCLKNNVTQLGSLRGSWFWSICFKYRDWEKQIDHYEYKAKRQRV